MNNRQHQRHGISVNLGHHSFKWYETCSVTKLDLSDLAENGWQSGPTDNELACFIWIMIETVFAGHWRYWWFCIKVITYGLTLSGWMFTALLHANLQTSTLWAHICDSWHQDKPSLPATRRIMRSDCNDILYRADAQSHCVKCVPSPNEWSHISCMLGEKNLCSTIKSIFQESKWWILDLVWHLIAVQNFPSYHGDAICRQDVLI